MNLKLKLALLTHYAATKEKQWEVAKKTNISDSRLSHIIYNRQKATKKEKLALAKILNCRAKDIF